VPALPIRQVITATIVRRGAPYMSSARDSLWICGQRKSVAHRSTGQQAAASINWSFRKRRSQTGRDIAFRHLCADPDRRSQAGGDG